MVHVTVSPYLPVKGFRKQSVRVGIPTVKPRVIHNGLNDPFAPTVMYDVLYFLDPGIEWQVLHGEVDPLHKQRGFFQK